MSKCSIMFVIFWGTLLSTLSVAETAPTVRFWEGAKNKDISYADHHKYVAETLAPGTVVAGFGALEHYVVYLPPRRPLPEHAYYRTLPFSEAAIPIYRDQLGYDAARAKHPEYGPLHFVPFGFMPDVSYSATPVRFLSTPPLEIASRDHRVAYDLHPSEDTTTVDSGAALPDWQKGTTLVWLMLREAEASESEYLTSVSRLFSEFQRGVAGTDGHYARVSEGHVLHFINVTEKDMIDRVKEQLLTLVRQDVNSALIDFDLTEAKSLEPFAAGWGEAFTFGSAINVQFPVKL